MKVLIVGGVAGGAGTAARLRRNDEHAEIIMFEKGPYISFANCGLPYYIGGVITDKAKLQLQTPESFHARFDVDVRVNNEVLRVDTAAKCVEVKNLVTGETYAESYDVLVLSPGASPVRPPIKGIDTAKVFTLRNIPDTYAIHDYVTEHRPKTAAVIGGGFIGVEMAENLHAAGVEVTIVEAQSHIMANLDEDMTHDLHNHIRSKGVGLCLNAAAAEFTPDSVILSNGARIPAEMIILSVGVRPETRFLEGSGIELGRRGEILVDERLRTNVADVYAVGDAISVRDIVTGEKKSIPLASPANRQARLVADIIAGKDRVYTGAQGTSIAKIFDMAAASTGASEASLKAAGIPYKKSYTFSASHAGYYPGGHSMQVKLIYSPEGVVLGGQITGSEGVDKRIDQIATAVRHGFTVYDLQELELSYAPPFSSAKDPVNMAGYAASNVIEGTFKPFYIEDLAALPADAQLVDVRTPGEFARGTIDGAVNIPVDELRARIGELDPARPVYIFCQVGLRGYIAERIAEQHGLTCRNLSGGYRFYEAAKLDAEGQAAAEKEYEYCGMEKQK